NDGKLPIELISPLDQVANIGFHLREAPSWLIRCRAAPADIIVRSFGRRIQRDKDTRYSGIQDFLHATFRQENAVRKKQEIHQLVLDCFIDEIVDVLVEKRLVTVADDDGRYADLFSLAQDFFDLLLAERLFILLEVRK